MKKIFSLFILSVLAISSLVYFIPSSALAAALQPNDPYFSKQWGLYNYGQVVDTKGDTTFKAWTPGVDINAREAWGTVYGSGKNYGSPIIIAIIDTGVNYNHEDLKDRVLRDNFGNIVGYDFVDNDNDPMDNNGHGTAIASIAAAAGNNNIGMAGVIWDAKIMPIRILDNDGVGDVNKIKSAIRFAADNGANVINLSIVSNAYDASLTEDLTYAYNKGAVLVAAAGNDNSSLTNYPRSPISNDGDRNIVIGVGAVNSADQKLDRSNYGKGVDISAPGTNILSAYYNKTNSKSEYNLVSGTSAATAVVSGAAALIKNYHRDWTNKSITDIILTTVTPFSEKIDGMGAGRLNLSKAINVVPAIPQREKGQAIKAACGNTIYITLGDKAAVPLTSPEVFLSLGYQWNEVISVSDSEILSYNLKLPIKPDWLPKAGSLVMGSSQTIYLVESNRLRGFETWNAFCTRGHKLSQVALISDVIVNAYKRGSNIK